MKIKKKKTTGSDQRGRGRGVMGEGRGRVKSRNMYKGHMGKDKGWGGLNVGGVGWVGQGRVMGENGDSCNKI